MATGICKISGGWAGQQDSVKVRYDEKTVHEIPADQYKVQGYSPPIETLPECPAGEESDA